jgi:hypothetical protein
LLSLSPFVDHERFGDIAETVLSTHGQQIESSPMEHTTLTLAADRRQTGDLELTVSADSLPAAWRDRLAEAYLPNRILARRPPTAEGLSDWLATLDLDEAPAIWKGRDAQGSDPTLYTCRSFTCSPPVTSIDEALSWAEDLAPEYEG